MHRLMPTLVYDKPRLPNCRPVSMVCYDCEHIVVAVTLEQLQENYQAHVDYVNACADRDEDPHFHEVRMDRLLADV